MTRPTVTLGLLAAFSAQFLAVSALADGLPPFKDTFTKNGDQVYPWIRCSAFYRATNSTMKRRNITENLEDMKTAEVDMITISAVLIQQYSAKDYTSALQQALNEQDALFSLYFEAFSIAFTANRTDFWHLPLWLDDAKVCGNMRSSMVAMIENSK